MKKLLVTTDGSELSEFAFPVADKLRRELNAEVVLTMVSPLPETKTQAEDEHTDLEDELDEVADRFPVTVRRRLETAGDAVDGILHVAREEGADLIVMATHGRGGPSSIANGSVAEGVLKRSDVPVLLVPPTASRDGNGPR